MTQHPDAPSLLRRHPAAGFTIVELMVAITLMGIIAAVIGTFIGWDSYLCSRAETRARSDTCYTLHALQ